MTIRNAEEKDTAQLDALLTKLIRDEARFDGNLQADCEVTDNYCNRIGLEGHKLILAEENGEIVGFLYGFLYHIPGIYKAPIAILDALFIEEEHRRKGYASVLIDAFRAFAIESGAVRIELKVVSDNADALALYRKLAFAETKKYMKLEL